MAADSTAAPGWDSLLTRDGQDRLAEIESAVAAGYSLERAGEQLRARGVPPDEVAAALTQHTLRDAAVSKFGAAAAHMLFTRAGLEQATRAPVAARHAQRFVEAGCERVADLGCGIGAESLAFQSAGLTPLPVEIDPFTAALAQHNLRLADPRISVIVGDAQTQSLTQVDGVFLDPARRTAGHSNTRRLTSSDDYSPSREFAFGLAERVPTGIKLGPGFDREQIPDGAEAQWVSVDGQLVEMGLWFGPLARPGVRRSALIIRDHDNGALNGERSDELNASQDAVDAASRPLGDVLYEPDGAVIRARLIGLLADQLGAGMVGDGIAYLTADTHVATPFATAFRIVEQLPSGEKQLRRALSERGIGRLEIKKRGVAVEPAVLRRRLHLTGPHEATLIMTRAQGDHVALLAERI